MSAPPRTVWPWQAVTRPEVAWAAAWALLIMVLTCLPYLYGVTLTPYEGVYLGYVFNPDEPNVHLSWIRQAREGRVFFRNEFTSEPHQGRFFNLFFLSLGRLARWGNLSPYWIFQLARLVSGWLLLIVVYLGVAQFTGYRPLRQRAFFLVATSSGLGWLYSYLAAGQGPLDPVDTQPGLVMPEAITFLTLYLNPLFAASMGLLMAAFVCGAVALRERQWPLAVGGGLAALLLGNIHTYDILPLYGSLGGYALVRGVQRREWPWRELLLWGLLMALSCPSVLYQHHLIQTDELYAAKANTWTPSPGLGPYPSYAGPKEYLAAIPYSLGVYALSYGLLVPLAIGGAVRILKRYPLLVPFVVWAGFNVLLLYLPVPFQRKMAEGLHIPLSVLAAVALTWLVRWIGVDMARVGARSQLTVRRRLPFFLRWLTVGGLLCLLPSNVAFVQSTLHDLQTNNLEKRAVLMPPFYLSREVYEGLLWLRENTSPEAVVLCTPLVGNYIPPVAGRRVFVGHWAETIGLAAKLGLMLDFFGRKQEAAEKMRFLRDYGLTHIFLGPDEQALNRAQVETLPGLRLVWRKGTVEIYAVETDR
ncbi:MAG TPA: hypothetical protein EYP85_14935 [Armatimonadetes bacterium]|nr:hypothetical protein [Armatimonadota bacterium]